MVTRLVLAEDSFLMREGVTALIQEISDFALLASCENYDELMSAVAQHEPDVVITDIRMPPTQTDEGIRAAHELRVTHPNIGVVVLSQYAEPEFAIGLFRDGSEGRAYLLKERVGDLGQLQAAVEAVRRGGSMMDPQVVDLLVASRRTSILDRLTERETEVLAEIAKGGNNSTVGDALFISTRAVEKHISAIFTKLDLSHADDAHRRVRAVLIYLAEAGS